MNAAKRAALRNTISRQICARLKEYDFLITVSIRGASIVRQKHSPDHIYLLTTLPSPFPAETEPLTLRFETPQGQAQEYVHRHFPRVAVEMLDLTQPDPDICCISVPSRAAGGHARAAALSPGRRSEIARAAAHARWAKVKK